MVLKVMIDFRPKPESDVNCNNFNLITVSAVKDILVVNHTINSSRDSYHFSSPTVSAGIRAENLRFLTINKYFLSRWHLLLGWQKITEEILRENLTIIQSNLSESNIDTICEMLFAEKILDQYSLESIKSADSHYRYVIYFQIL